MLECRDTGELSHECVDLAKFYHDKDIAASELYSEILDCKGGINNLTVIKL